MTTPSPLLVQLKSNQLTSIIILGLFMPLSGFRGSVAHAFAPLHARISSRNNINYMMFPSHDESDGKRRQRQPVPSETRRALGNNTSCKKTPRDVKATTKFMTLASVLVPFLLAIKSASAQSGILSSASDLLGNADITQTSSYHLTRILFIRLLAIVYTAAFSVAKFQNRGLIGDRGITPAKNVLDAAELRGRAKSARRKEWMEQRKSYHSITNNNPIAKCKNAILDSKSADVFREKFWHRTDRMGRPLISLLWFAADRDNLNMWLDSLANVGLFLSTAMLVTGSANILLMVSLWLIQRSFMSVGGPWYGYGWEPQLAELTFHAIFLVPLLSMNPFFGLNASSSMGPFPVPSLVIFAIRWYLFKIMMGAGLIKVKSNDVKWKPGDMSAMDYFYETQPVPNPFTRYFHFMPKAWHRFEVWSNHFVELVAPFLLLMPFRQLRLAGGLIQIVFQLVLISSGNLSFLNWLTIVPALVCLDDAFLANHLPHSVQSIVLGTSSTKPYIQAITSGEMSLQHAPVVRNIVSTAFFLFMANLNRNVVRNLFSKHQVMNGSFDKLRLCCTYGAFGVVSETREELIIESAADIEGPWREYHFKVKPGDVHRRPRWISPYHHRIDWQMWIASVSGRVERSPWIYSLLLKLLKQEKDVIGLLESDPWQTGGNSGKPKYIRVEKYRYKFYDSRVDVGSDGKGGGNAPFWVRERISRYFPQQGGMTADILETFV